MSVQWIVTKIDDEGEFLSVFGQLVFTGSYIVGGESPTVALDLGSAGVAGTTKNTASLPVFLSGQTGVHATRPPFEFNVQLDVGAGATHAAIPILLPGSGALNFKIKLVDANTGAELTAAAYSGQAGKLSDAAAIGNYLLAKFKKNV